MGSGILRIKETGRVWGLYSTRAMEDPVATRAD